jgi:predicted esterase
LIVEAKEKFVEKGSLVCQEKLKGIWLLLLFGCAHSTCVAATDAEAAHRYLSEPMSQFGGDAALPALRRIRFEAIADGASPDSPTSQQTLHAATVANVPVLIAAPRRITQRTPLIIMYHGFGPPNSPELLAKALPPIHDALTVCPSLPLLGARMPAGGVDELVHRQTEDYIGRLLYPSILGAAQELPQIIESLSKTYGLSKSSPVILFGFSAGGAAALLSLTESSVRPRAVLVVNSPLSIAAAVDGYERQSKRAYAWTDRARDASAHYDIEKSAMRIAQLNPKAAFLILQSEHDGFSFVAAQSAATALKNAASRYGPEPDISAVILPGADHYVLDGAESTTAKPNGAPVKQMIIDWMTQHAFAESSSP